MTMVEMPRLLLRAIIVGKVVAMFVVILIKTKLSSIPSSSMAGES